VGTLQTGAPALWRKRWLIEANAVGRQELRPTGKGYCIAEDPRCTPVQALLLAFIDSSPSKRDLWRLLPGRCSPCLASHGCSLFEPLPGLAWPTYAAFFLKGPKHMCSREAVIGCQARSSISKPVGCEQGLSSAAQARIVEGAAGAWKARAAYHRYLLKVAAFSSR